MMNPFFKKIILSLSLFILRERIERKLRAARFAAARNILLSADALRVFLSHLFLAFILTSMMGAGIALFMVGLCSIIAMYFMVPDLFRLFFWMPVGFCLGGLICFLPSFVLMKYKLFSEKVWLDALKNNKIFGNFLRTVLDEAAELKTK